LAADAAALLAELERAAHQRLRLVELEAIQVRRREPAGGVRLQVLAAGGESDRERALEVADHRAEVAAERVDVRAGDERVEVRVGVGLVREQLDRPVDERLRTGDV